MSADGPSSSGADHRETIPQPHGGRLCAPWQRGQSGNPNGRRAFGAVVTEWYNAMANYEAADLEAVIADPSQPSAKVAAARQVLAARNGEMESHREVCDRTDGRPIQQTINHNTNERVKRVIVPAPSGN